MDVLVRREGYPLESHYVTTPDGYILNVFRIPHGVASGDARANRGSGGEGEATGATESEPNQSKIRSARRALAVVREAEPESDRHSDSASAQAAGGRSETRCLGKPVLLQHGLLDSSASWVNNGAEKSLSFLLADAGFDVWMGNVRGNIFSRNHTSLSSWSAAFWDWSVDEMASFDLPAMMELVLTRSGCEELQYVGHSQGTTLLLATLATRADLRKRVSSAVLLAPVAFVTHITSQPVRALAEMQTDEVVAELGVKEFLPNNAAAAQLAGRVCRKLVGVCEDALDAICGYSRDNINASRLPLYLQFAPAGTSVRTMVQWGQAVRQLQPDCMSFYDFGSSCTDSAGRPQRCNRIMYDRDRPPVYNLSAVHTRLSLFTGGLDKLAPALDVEMLREQLPPGATVLHHHEPRYQHLDFVWGQDAHRRIYPAVLRFLSSHPAPTPPTPNSLMVSAQ